MANTKSAAKRARQTLRKTVENKRVLTQIKTNLKKVRGANAGAAEEIVLVSALDRAAKTGRIHRNTANRLKSRLNKKRAKPAA